MLVIINADDLGVNQTCNDVIFDLMAQGRITSATILANCPGTDDALRRAQDFPQCSFGVHLNATTGQPIRKDPALEPILDENGRFHKNLQSRKFSKSTRHALFLEFCAQIDRIKASGIPISHLDSHHHVHNLPAVFPVLKAVQRHYGIRKVRISQNLYPPGHHVPAHLRMKKSFYNWALRYYYQTKTTDCFTDLRTFLQVLRTTRLGFQSVEVMVHPGPRKYTEETSLLQTPWLDEFPKVARTISYHAL
jgi:predicted glycoside hydrolase/deacetylase ChbG (UPF0249 family)